MLHSQFPQDGITTAEPIGGGRLMEPLEVWKWIVERHRENIKPTELVVTPAQRTHLLSRCEPQMVYPAATGEERFMGLPIRVVGEC